MISSNKSSLQKIILGNAGLLFISEFFNRGIIFVLSAIIAQHLGVIEFGKMSSALAFVGIFSLISDFGMTTLFIKDASRDFIQRDHYIINILTLKFLLSILTFVILVIFAYYFKYDNSFTIVLYLSYLYTVLLSFVTFIRSLFKISNKLVLDTVISVMGGILFFIIVLTLLQFYPTLNVILCGYIFATLIIFLLTIGVILKFGLVKLAKVNKHQMAKIVKSASPYLLSTLCIYFYYFIDQILLFNISGAIAAGIYGAAYRILVLLIAPIGLFSIVLLPIFSKDFKSILSIDLRNTIKQNALYLFFWSTFAFLTMLLFSKNVILTVYGTDYTDSIYIFKLLLVSWYLLVNYSIPAICLQAFDLQSSYLKISAAGAIFNLLTNLYLIPIYSTAGAALATIATELLVGTLIIYVFFNKIWLKYE